MTEMAKIYLNNMDDDSKLCSEIGLTVVNSMENGDNWEEATNKAKATFMEKRNGRVSNLQ